ncbi:MAG: hypothetical protein LAT57_12390 [Balneolales bacterium]|nr:hypothetical protein [Balneolales bacterium]
MNRLSLISSVLLISFSFFAYMTVSEGPEDYSFDELRVIYSGDPSGWPSPHVDEGINWKELGDNPGSPFRNVDSLQALTSLGQVLFFDPRLSVSNQISCSSCHDPERSWQDGRMGALGHDHRSWRRNTPTTLNVWAIETLFWDGRAADLEEFSLLPIQDPIEMNMDLETLPQKLQDISGYPELFAEAFDDETVTLERIAGALSQFQRTLVSRASDFDRFMRGNENALSDRALHGMHLFRTKARCMNCHHGEFFTDLEFHNLGLHFYGREREDLGLYNVTGDPADMGKFRTPPLRDVAFTGPYTHNGLINSLEGMISMYDAGMARPRPRPGLEDDPHFPVTSDILIPLELTDAEKEALEAFLHAISERPFRMRRPELP